MDRIAKQRDSIPIPTPVLSEFLVCLPHQKIADLFIQLNASAWFRVEAFDASAAVELAIRTAIVAIAVVHGASEIVSDDPHVRAIGV